jgi:hypothetical protein
MLGMLYWGLCLLLRLPLRLSAPAVPVLRLLLRSRLASPLPIPLSARSCLPLNSPAPLNACPAPNLPLPLPRLCPHLP